MINFYPCQLIYFLLTGSPFPVHYLSKFLHIQAIFSRLKIPIFQAYQGKKKRAQSKKSYNSFSPAEDPVSVGTNPGDISVRSKPNCQFFQLTELRQLFALILIRNYRHLDRPPRHRGRINQNELIFTKKAWSRLPEEDAVAGSIRTLKLLSSRDTPSAPSGPRYRRCAPGKLAPRPLGRRRN